ncbi:MAG: hypothetical protein ACLQVI_26130 [Polyangiaceae bacterium]
MNTTKNRDSVQTETARAPVVEQRYWRDRFAPETESDDAPDTERAGVLELRPMSADEARARLAELARDRRRLDPPRPPPPRRPSIPRPVPTRAAREVRTRSSDTPIDDGADDADPLVAKRARTEFFSRWELACTCSDPLEIVEAGDGAYQCGVCFEPLLARRSRAS